MEVFVNCALHIGELLLVALVKCEIKVDLWNFNIALSTHDQKFLFH